MPLFIRLPAAVAALAAFGFAAMPAAAQNFSRTLPCEDTVPDRLAELGVEPGGIAGQLVEEDWMRGDDGDDFLGWIVWMEMKGCDGQLVMRLSPTCLVSTVYTRGNCRVDGVDQY